MAPITPADFGFSALKGQKHIPAHQRVYEALRRRITKGELSPGDQLPGESQLISDFKVSKITIRRALQNLATEGLVVGYSGKGTFVNDTLFPLAHQFLVVQGTDIITNYPYTQLIMEGIQSANMQSAPFRLEFMKLTPTQRQSPAETIIERLVDHAQIDGVIIITQHIANEQLTRLVQKVPVICIGSAHIDSPQGVTVITGQARLSPDFLLVEHLVSLNRKKIGFVKPWKAELDIPEHIKGVMSHFGLPFSYEIIERAEFGINHGRNATKTLLRRCPDLDAIIGGDDLMAMGIFQALLELGKKVPQDVAVAGIGGFWDEHSDCGITTIDIRLFDIGQTTVSCLHHLISGKKLDHVISLKPRLIPRQTTRG